MEQLSAKVKFWALNAPGNATIELEVALENNCDTTEEAIALAENVLVKYGLSQSNFKVSGVVFVEGWPEPI
jgi:hypothetical protein